MGAVSLALSLMNLSEGSETLNTIGHQAGLDGERGCADIFCTVPMFAADDQDLLWLELKLHFILLSLTTRSAYILSVTGPHARLWVLDFVTSQPFPCC